MENDTEKAQIMFKLARKDNWGGKYDRTEHFKRFPNLDSCIKELSKTGWIEIHNKGRFLGISLNTEYKKEIIEFIETRMPYLKGVLK